MNKILVYCLDGIVFVLLIVIFIINQSQISNHDSSKNSLVYIHHVVNNWNQTVFEDATVKPQKGYNRENLGYFEGSEIGCRCLDQVKNEYEYTYGKCETENDTCKTIEEILYYIPNKDEQDKISTFITLLDKKIELQQRSIEALKIYKRGLIQRIYNKTWKKILSCSNILYSTFVNLSNN